MFTANLSAVNLSRAGLNPAPAGIREFCMKKAQKSDDLKILVHNS